MCAGVFLPGKGVIGPALLKFLRAVLARPIQPRLLFQGRFRMRPLEMASQNLRTAHPIPRFDGSNTPVKMLEHLFSDFKIRLI